MLPGRRRGGIMLPQRHWRAGASRRSKRAMHACMSRKHEEPNLGPSRSGLTDIWAVQCGEQSFRCRRRQRTADALRGMASFPTTLRVPLQQFFIAKYAEKAGLRLNGCPCCALLCLFAILPVCNWGLLVRSFLSLAVVFNICRTAGPPSPVSGRTAMPASQMNYNVKVRGSQTLEPLIRQHTAAQRAQELVRRGSSDGRRHRRC